VIDNTTIYTATGRRKEATAVVRLIDNGSGKIKINSRQVQDYFPLISHRNTIEQPMKVTNTEGRFDIEAKVIGSGPMGQAGALRHAISRALVKVDISFKGVLKDSGLLTRDPRMKERKKSGQPGARKRYQFSKR
jgi:small subunit ribosomal protein S9